MKDQHLIVVSIDAMIYEDLEYAATLPNFGRILQNGAVIERVKTIYPSLTHPVHATLITGCPPMKTGICSNAKFVPGELRSPWYNRLEEIRCDTLLHAAHRAGLSTCACRWPLTAGGGDIIDYLVPEVMGLDAKGHEDDPLSVYRKLGTSECVMDIVEESIRRYGFTNAHPAYDEAEIFCAAEIIRRYKPNLLLTHPSYVDNMRHRTGVFGDGVKEALLATDRWLGMLLEAVTDAGIEDKTDIILLSDHGQINIRRTVCVNAILKEQGLIRTDENGAWLSWDAYCLSCAASAQVYLRDPENLDLYQSVLKLLKGLAKQGESGFERVFTKDEVRERYGLDGDFSFVLETDGASSFRDDWTLPILRPLDIEDYRAGHGTHGHLPEKGKQPTFIGCGPSFRCGARVGEGSILNHAPTMAQILHIDLPDAWGHAEASVLKG